jgi:hypothetical protein
MKNEWVGKLKNVDKRDGYFILNMWNDAYRVLKASMELCPASMTSPSQTTEKLAGF